MTNDNIKTHSYDMFVDEKSADQTQKYTKMVEFINRYFPQSQRIIKIKSIETSIYFDYAIYCADGVRFIWRMNADIAAQVKQRKGVPNETLYFLMVQWLQWHRETGGASQQFAELLAMDICHV